MEVKGLLDEHLRHIEAWCYDAKVNYQECTVRNGFAQMRLRLNEAGEVIYTYQNHDFLLPADYSPAQFWKGIVSVDPQHPFYKKVIASLNNTPVDTYRHEYNVTRRTFGHTDGIRAHLTLGGAIYVDYLDSYMFYKPLDGPWELGSTFHPKGEMVESTKTTMRWEGELQNLPVVVELTTQGLEVLWGGEPTTLDYLEDQYIEYEYGE